MYAQLTHSIGLNDVCDALGLHSGPLSSLRGATPPNRNTRSHANNVRPAAMAEQLFWSVLEQLGNLSPGFVSGKTGNRFARKFKRTIHLVDSTTIPLIASCLELGQVPQPHAQSRRQMSSAAGPAQFPAALLPLSIPPGITTPNGRGNCAPGSKTERSSFSTRLTWTSSIWLICRCGKLFWVTRAKENLNCRVVRYFQQGTFGEILRDGFDRVCKPPFPVLPIRWSCAGSWRWSKWTDGKWQWCSSPTTWEWSAQSIVGAYALPLADRGLLQANQTDPATGRLSRHHGQCGALAGVGQRCWFTCSLRYLAFLSNWSHSFTWLLHAHSRRPVEKVGTC